MDHSPGFLAHVEARRPLVTEIAIPDALAALEADSNALLIDVREDYEWMGGHAVGARHMSRGTLERDIEKAVPDTATPMILYCGGGFRSILATRALMEMGYSNVRSIIGGWRGWLEAQAPTECPPAMTKATGIGGVLFRSPHPAALREWYRRHLGLEPMEKWGAVLNSRDFTDPRIELSTAWSVSPMDTKYFGDSGQSFMINYRVRNLDELVTQLHADGVFVDKVEDSDFGKFAWVKDGDGNRVELWQPV